MTPAELERRDQLTTYLNKCSEDELIEELLLPLFRQLGFHRITAAGHKDKALEYGKDVWMKYTLHRRVKVSTEKYAEVLVPESSLHGPDINLNQALEA